MKIRRLLISGESGECLRLKDLIMRLQEMRASSKNARPEVLLIQKFEKLF